MAIYNEILAARFARALQKFLSMKGPVATKQLSGEVMPTIPLFFGADARFLEGWNRFIAAGNAPAVAAQTSVVHFRNPVNSGVIAVLERIGYSSSTGGIVLTMGYQQPGADATNVFRVNRLDSRGNVNANMIISGGNNIAQFGTSISVSKVSAIGITGEIINHEGQEVPLLPGETLQFTPGALNTQLDVYIVWRERALEESEKQF